MSITVTRPYIVDLIVIYLKYDTIRFRWTGKNQGQRGRDYSTKPKFKLMLTIPLDHERIPADKTDRLDTILRTKSNLRNKWITKQT
jgi:hypothetical protein